MWRVIHVRGEQGVQLALELVARGRRQLEERERVDQVEQQVVANDGLLGFNQHIDDPPESDRRLQFRLHDDQTE